MHELLYYGRTAAEFHTCKLDRASCGHSGVGRSVVELAGVEDLVIVEVEDARQGSVN